MDCITDFPAIYPPIIVSSIAVRLPTFQNSISLLWYPSFLVSVANATNVNACFNSCILAQSIEDLTTAVQS